MNGKCQTCGAVAPIEWFLSEDDHRQVRHLLILLPKEVQGVVFNYLALFRSQTGKALQVKKAVRLLTEIVALVEPGHVQVERKPARPCLPKFWAQAMEQMIERRDRLTLPMPNHNYLKAIAWDLADHEDARLERAGMKAVRSVATTTTKQSALSPLDQYIQGLRDDKPSDEEMEQWRKTRLK